MLKRTLKNKMPGVVIWRDGTKNATTGGFGVVTIGASTLTLQRVDIVTGSTITIDWGDGSSNTYDDTANGSTKTHAYSGAGSFALTIKDARNIKEVDFRDAKIVSFNSSFFKSCGDNLISISLYHTLTTPVIDSTDMAHLHLSNRLYLSCTQAGTYAIDSSHFASYTLSSQLFLNFSQAGTYSIDSSDFASYTLSLQLLLYFSQAGTYAIDSSDFAAYTLSSRLYLFFNQTGTFSKTIARADFNGFTALPTVVIEMGLDATDVDNILLGFYDALASKTNTGGTIDLAGNGNAAPSGTYQAQVPPITGKEAAYELLNDSGGISTKHWATVTVEGGLP